MDSLTSYLDNKRKVGKASGYLYVYREKEKYRKALETVLASWKRVKNPSKTTRTWMAWVEGILESNN